MLNQYETVFIVTPVLSDEQMKEMVQKFKTVIKDNGGEVIHEENWGLRKLAYPIKNKNTGYYALLEFKGEGSLVETLETEYRRDEQVIRFLTFKLDKYSIEYSERRKKNQKDPEKQQQQNNNNTPKKQVTNNQKK